MEISTSAQLEFFLWCLLAGVTAGVLYDLLRISRKMIKTHNTAVIIEDIIFLAGAAALSFFVAFVKNSSELRWYQFFGNIAGFAVYKVIAKDTLVDLGIKLLNIITKIFLWMVKIILFPVVVLCKIFRKPFMIVVWYVRKNAKKITLKANTRLKITKNVLFRRKK